MVWVAKRINEQVLFHPRDVVTATEFNSLFNLLIAQGNNNAQGVEGLIGIFGSVTDGESGADYIKVTPISGVTGTNVQEILEGLKGLVDQRYTKSETDVLLGGKASNAVVAKLVKNVQFEEGTGKFTFVFQDDTTKVIDTAMEKIAVNFSYDAETQSLVLEHADGSTESISLAEFVTNNEFSNSDTINISVVNGVVKAEIGTGVITDAMLSTTLLATLAGYVSSASGSAQAAASSESNASTYAGTASNAAQTATQKAADASGSADNATAQANKSKSYAVGGTGTREGEDTDNAQYYLNQANLRANDAYDYMIEAKNAAATASGFDYKGEWDANTTYTQGQLVSYDLTLWTAKTNNLNSIPYDGSADWSVFVGIPSVLDLGGFTDTLAEHAMNPNAHEAAVFDANNSEPTTQATLEEHEISETAHGNLNIDGGGQ